MAHWLFKEEPEHFSFEELQMEGMTAWDGVKNNLALRNLKSVAKGDMILYYHTGDEKCVVGLAVCTESRGTVGYPHVSIKAVKKFKHRVPLSAIKTAGQFKDEPLVRIPRLSVMPVGEKLWKFIIGSSGIDIGGEERL